LYVIEHAYVVEVQVRGDLRDVLMHLGDDQTGRALEVGVVEEGDRLVVVHAMDMRPKYRAVYEEGKRNEQQGSAGEGDGGRS
jgi:hypothetical protein